MADRKPALEKDHAVFILGGSIGDLFKGRMPAVMMGCDVTWEDEYWVAREDGNDGLVTYGQPQDTRAQVVLRHFLERATPKE